jgi:hypothetical protein
MGMKCRNAKNLIFEFIDGLEDDTKRLELEKHLAGCGECDKFATQLTRSLDLLHRAPREETSDNFAWKVRLKLNQERNAVRERHSSYGVIVRSWNLRYATAAVAAAAVVLVGGLAVLQNGLGPVSPASDSPSSSTAAEPTQRPSISASPVERISDRSTPARPTIRGSAGPRMVSNLGAPRRSTGRIIGVDLIDRSAPLSVAQMDSLVHEQLEQLTTDEQVRYLSQSILVLQRHLIKAHMDRLTQK